jgi:hypothetical protein
MEKLDLTKEFKAYYTAKAMPEQVKFGSINYLTITGKGEPGGEEFLEKTSALYPVAYSIKKICKSKDMDFAVPKLEGLWWVKSDKPAFSVPRSEWFWKLLIRMPDFVSADIFTNAVEEVMKKKKISVANEVKFEKIDEGNLVSILHVGPYATEPESIGKMDAFISKNNLKKNGHHHEIYLSDPNKSEAGKMKTILRQPVK